MQHIPVTYFRNLVNRNYFPIMIQIQHPMQTTNYGSRIQDLGLRKSRKRQMEKYMTDIHRQKDREIYKGHTNTVAGYQELEDI